MTFHIRDIHSNAIQKKSRKKPWYCIQYKCNLTFYDMKVWATEFDIKITWFYGEPGGLGDAMSSFGCNQQLCHEVVTNDSWSQNVEETVQFLTQYFSTDNSKEYHLADKLEQRKMENLN